MKLNELTTNVKNPRILKDARFKKLLNKILCYPNLLSKRKITFDSSDNNVILGGNMRFKTINHIVKSVPLKNLEEVIKTAHKALNLDNETLLNNSIAIFTEVKQSKAVPSEWIQDVIGLSEDEKTAFILIDNLNDGEWDLDAIANEWDIDTGEWGLISWDVPSYDNTEEEEDKDYSDKNTEYNDEDFEDKAAITLNFNLETYEIIKTELLKHGQSYEDAVCNLLGIKPID
mgnify:CR=1 FL=1